MPASPEIVESTTPGRDDAHLLEVLEPPERLPLADRIRVVLGGLTTVERTIDELRASIATGTQDLAATNRECDSARELHRALLEEIAQRQAELRRYEVNIQAIADQSVAAVEVLRRLPDLCGVLPTASDRLAVAGRSEENVTPEVAQAVARVRQIAATMMVVTEEVDRRAAQLDELGHRVAQAEGRLGEVTRVESEVLGEVNLVRQVADGLSGTVEELHIDQRRTERTLAEATALLRWTEGRQTRRASRFDRVRRSKPGVNDDGVRSRGSTRRFSEANGDRVAEDLVTTRQDLAMAREELVTARTELELVLGVVRETYDQSQFKRREIADAEAAIRELRRERDGLEAEIATLKRESDQHGSSVARFVRQEACEEDRLRDLRQLIQAAERDLAASRAAAAAADSDALAMIDLAESQRERAASIEAEAWRTHAAILADAERTAAAILEGATDQANRLTGEEVVRQRGDLEPRVVALRAEYERLHAMVLDRIDTLGNLEKGLEAVVADHRLAETDRDHLRRIVTDLAQSREKLERALSLEKGNADRVLAALRDFLKQSVEKALRELIALKAANEAAKTKANEPVTTISGSRRFIEIGTHVVILVCGGAVLALDAVPVVRAYIPSGGAVTAVLATGLVYLAVWGIKNRWALKAAETPLRLAEKTIQQFFVELDPLLDECRRVIDHDLFLASDQAKPKRWLDWLLGWMPQR